MDYASEGVNHMDTPPLGSPIATEDKHLYNNNNNQQLKNNITIIILLPNSALRMRIYDNGSLYNIAKSEDMQRWIANDIPLCHIPLTELL